jgi:hypothetical protein
MLALGFSAAAGEPEAPPEKPADKPAAPEVKPEQTSGGLQLTLVMKDRSFRAGRGDNATEIKFKQPTIQLKNTGDKPLVIDFQLPAGGGFGGGRFGGPAPAGGDAGPVKVTAKDSNGKEVPKPEQRGNRDDQPKPEDRPAVLTVLKPGQTLEGSLLGAVRFPADGKYTLQAEINVTAKDEVLPGVKPWSGKLKSNELEYDYKNPGGNAPGGGRNNRPGGGAQPPAPPANPDKEAF